MDTAVDVETEPPLKKQKLENSWEDPDGLSLSPEFSGSIPATSTSKIPNLENGRESHIASPSVSDPAVHDASDLKAKKNSITTTNEVADISNNNGSNEVKSEAPESDIKDPGNSEPPSRTDNQNKKKKKKSSPTTTSAEASVPVEPSPDKPGPVKKKKVNKHKKPKASALELKASKSIKNANKRKAANLRKNIKDILKTEKLGEETLAAQREEAERRERMNLKLQLQQQQLRLLSRQQSGDTGSSIDNLLSKIVSERHSHSGETTPVNNEPAQPLPLPTFLPIPDQQCQQKQQVAFDDPIVLSSDEEPSSPGPDINISDLLRPKTHQVPHPQLPIGHFGGSVSRNIDFNIISISSEDEADEICDKEVESLENVRQQRHDMRKMQPASTHGESDDDCVVISPPPDQEDIDKDEKNQDELNILDEFGRVLVNVGHPDEDPDIFLAPQVARIVKPHQIGGIRFLYDNVVESVDRFNTSSGFGCILAHSMGLGKTLQAVSFCDIFLRASKGTTVLIIVPINTIQNWLNEFNVWIPVNKPEGKKKSKKVKNGPTIEKTSSSSQSSISDTISETISLNLSFDSTLNLCPDVNELSENQDGKSTPNLEPKESNSSGLEDVGEVHTRSFNVFVLNETVKTLQARERIISDWAGNGGVLLIGYEMYRMLALKKLKRSTKKHLVFNGDDRESEMETLNKIHGCLVNPGPDLVICDEGHRIKNSGASISQALKAIRTKRRVVLTGYPLQNNLMEYWCMVDFIRPNYLGSKVEFSNMFERPISNGQCVDSTPEDRRLMRFRSHVLHSLLEGFVQRRSHAVLQTALPAKHEWVFMLKMTPMQYKLYKAFMKYLSDNLEGQCGANPIKAFAVCCKIWNHPDALYNVVKKKQSILDDLDLDELSGTGDMKKNGPRGKKDKRENSSQISYFDGSGFNFPRSHYGSYGSNRSGSEALSLDWALPIFENYEPGVLENGVKFEILFEIIRETVAVKDKILVFSQTLLSLDLIETFFHQKFKWTKNIQYYRLDGGTTGLERERLINNFNAKDDVFVFLVSTRAGSLGINLTGANRVVVLDASWNPCHDCQAVCRIYRYGQTKPCQIYRFVSDCSLEKRIYDRQINKRGMSDRVVDEMNPNAQFKSKDVSSFLVLKHDHLDKLMYIKCDLTPEKYSADPLLQNVLLKHGDKLTQEPFEHESLLIDQKSQRLSATEKRLAHRNYQNEKRSAELQNSSGYTYNRPSYAAYYPRESTNSSSQAPRLHTNPISNYRQFQLSNEDKFEQHVPALKAKGICVQYIVLKKDSFLADPSGGPDMYLMAGEKVYVLRSEKGTYLRISNGKLIAVRNNPSNTRYPVLNLPCSEDLSREQLQGLVYSFLKVPGQSFASDSYGYGSNYLGPHNSSSSYHPSEQPLPPSASFFNQTKNHLQVTNTISNSGGDVTLWQPLPLEERLGVLKSPRSENLTLPRQSSSNHGESSLLTSSKHKSLSALLESSNESSFNPNLERLSYLANRFPDMSLNAEANFLRKRRMMGMGDQTSFPSGLSLLQYPNLSVQNLSRENSQSDVQLIPISNSNGTTHTSPSTSHNSSPNILGRSRSRPLSEVESLLSNPLSSRHKTSLQKSFESNPSFYEDFTITLKNNFGIGSNSNSSSSLESSQSTSTSIPFPPPLKSHLPASTATLHGSGPSSMSNSVINNDSSSNSGNDAGASAFLPSCLDSFDFSTKEDVLSELSQSQSQIMDSEVDNNSNGFPISQYYPDELIPNVSNSFSDSLKPQCTPSFYPNQGD